jgi:hypothetical protein
MTTVHTMLREDFGRLDRTQVGAELLAERGIKDVLYETQRNRLSIEYDPAIVDGTKLIDIMCRHGVYPEPIAPHLDDSTFADAFGS